MDGGNVLERRAGPLGRCDAPFGAHGPDGPAHTIGGAMGWGALAVDRSLVIMY